MDEHLVADCNGLYGIKFMNVYNLPRLLIKHLMDLFGTVVKLDVPNDRFSWVIIRYANPEEAVRAMSGLNHNHRDILDPNYLQYTNDDMPQQFCPDQKPRIFHGRVLHSNNGDVCMSSRDELTRSGHLAADQVSSQHRYPTIIPQEIKISNWPSNLNESDLYNIFTKHDLNASAARIENHAFSSVAYFQVPSFSDLDHAFQKLNGLNIGTNKLRLTWISDLQDENNGSQPHIYVSRRAHSPRRRDESRPVNFAVRGLGRSVTQRLQPYQLGRPSYSVGTQSPVQYRSAPSASIRGTLSRESTHTNSSLRQPNAYLTKFDQAAPKQMLDPDIRKHAKQISRTIKTSPRNQQTNDSIEKAHIMREQLHKRTVIVVCNFSSQTSDHDLRHLFSKYGVESVQMCESKCGSNFRYALIAIRSVIGADRAIEEMDGYVFDGCHLIVEQNIV